MTERFYCPDVSEERAVLTESEAHHLAHVMRIKVGEQVKIFNGHGQEYLCEVEKIGKREVALKVLEKLEDDRETARPVVIAAPLPKGDRQRFIVEKLTELGVSTFTPLLTERTVVRPEPDAVERLTRVVIEACKQCGRNRLMSVRPPCRWEEFLATVSPESPRWLAHPHASESRPVPSSLLDGFRTDWGQHGAPLVAAVGPEGGFTPEEVNLAVRHGWQLIDLGPRILRVETAAIALAVLLATAQQIRIHQPPG